MPRRIPRSLIFTLAAIAVVSFAVSLYLEIRQLDFLQAHPIMVNLISGVVGFSSGFLALSIGVNWFYERQWALDHLPTLRQALLKVETLEEMAEGEFDADFDREKLDEACELLKSIGNAFEPFDEPLLGDTQAFIETLYKEPLNHATFSISTRVYWMKRDRRVLLASRFVSRMKNRFLRESEIAEREQDRRYRRRTLLRIRDNSSSSPSEPPAIPRF